jgi:hypothetical protein
LVRWALVPQVLVLLAVLPQALVRVRRGQALRVLPGALQAG